MCSLDVCMTLFDKSLLLVWEAVFYGTCSGGISQSGASTCTMHGWAHYEEGAPGF